MRARRMSVLVLALLIGGVTPLSGQWRKPTSTLVYPGKEGRLVYAPDERGNTIPDFSNCGYMGGGVRPPEVPVIASLTPLRGSSDDTPRIQDMIDEISRRTPDPQGFHGAILLRRGVYRIGGSLRIGASGIVLRGEGDGEDGTILLGTGKGQRALIQVAGEGNLRTIPRSVRRITNTYVPVGAKSFDVEDASSFRAGQRVLVRRKGNASWISEIRMDRIPPRPGNPSSTRQWSPFDLDFERVITHIDAQRVTVDAPIVNAIQAEYGGGELIGYEFPGRIEQVGIEHLRGVSEFDSSKKDNAGKRFIDEDHAWSFIRIANAENCWVRSITARYFGYACVDLERGAKHVTVQDSKSLEMVAVVTGGRMYPFDLNGQLNLFLRCYALDARHAFVQGSRVPGPNAYVDCHSVSDGESGPHHRWSTGTLYDNVRIDKGGLRVYDRGYMGSGHGWSGAQKVFWNCTAEDIRNANPPTAINWAIGCTSGKHTGDGWWESPSQPVEPRSLYLQQLEDRLGKKAVEALAPVR